MSLLEVTLHSQDGNCLTRIFTNFKFTTECHLDPTMDASTKEHKLQITAFEHMDEREVDAIKALIQFQQGHRYVFQKEKEIPERIVDLMRDHMTSEKQGVLHFLITPEGLAAGSYFRVPPEFRHPAIPSSSQGKGGYADVLEALGFQRKPRSIALGCYHDWIVPMHLDLTYLRRTIMMIHDEL